MNHITYNQARTGEMSPPPERAAAGFGTGGAGADIAAGLSHDVSPVFSFQ